MADVCPCCRQRVEAAGADPLVAACDMLVLRALELVGKRIVRADRSRYARMGDQPWHEAHLNWQPDPNTVDRGLAGAWDAVPVLLIEHGCCGLSPDQLVVVLDRYVRDLLAVGAGHAVGELRYRLGAYLGVPMLDT